MKNNNIYYLRKYQRLLCTSKKENAPAVIDVIDSEIVFGHFIDDDTPFSCMQYEFKRIFKRKRS